MSGRPLLTGSTVRQLLAEHGLAPRRRDGQHFVVDPSTVRAIVRDAGIQAADRVLEIGAGLGSLTLALREAGAHVIAVELDAGLVRACADVIGDDAGVQLVHGDVLALDLDELLAEPATAVANLPYHAATPILMRLLASPRITGAMVMVQREVGERWVAEPDHPRFGAVSVKVAAHASARVVRRVAREAFFPVPGVDSVTVAVHPRPWTADVPRAAVLAVVEAGFAQRRKQLKTALAARGWDRDVVAAALEDIGLDAAVRAERLDLDAWVALSRVLIGAPGRS